MLIGPDTVFSKGFATKGVKQRDYPDFFPEKMSVIQPEWVQKLHVLNGLVHQEPFSTLVWCMFWYLFLLFSCPILGFAVLFYSAYYLIRVYLFKKDISPNSLPDTELAVFITGCDTGFGKELAFSLMTKGFFVFAGCLDEKSFDNFKGEDKITPVKCDVTNETEVEEAYKTVKAWLDDKSMEGKKKRYFHALVNNAGKCLRSFFLPS